MNEYKKQLVATQCAQLNSDTPLRDRMTNGIPNSVLTEVFAGRRRVTDEMMGHRQSLAESVQAKMTQAFGMDISRLKFYRSDAMAGTDMKGVSRGDTVVLSSDVNLNTGAGQAVLGHELSHIRAQSRGIGTGRSGLYSNAALERQADREGYLAALGRPVFEQPLTGNPGLRYGLGMRGVENLTPISANGISDTAGAPMQAKKLGTKKDAPEKSASTQNQQQRAENRPAQVNGQQPEGEIRQLRTERGDGVDPALRREIPLAWEHQVGGDPREGPKLHIFMKQQKRGDSTDSEGFSNESHGYMGLEYTRSSRIRGGAKRFRSTFGFYGKGKESTLSIFGQGALVPGTLKDDTGYGSDASRSYPITYQQLNAMARFASTYESGGYNSVDRNCTTFVADTVKAGGVNVGNILQSEDWTVGPAKRVALGAMKVAGVFAPNDYGANEFRTRMNKKDLRYGVNKNLYTQDEIDRFIGSHKLGGVSLHGHNPSPTGERMRTDKTGGLSGMATESEVTKQIDSLTEAGVKAELQKSIERQMQISGKNWNNSAGSILNAVNGLDIAIGNFKRCVDTETSVRMEVRPEHQQRLYREFEANAQRILNDMDAWFFRYGTTFTVIAQTVMDICGSINLMDSLFSDEIRTLDFRPEDESKAKTDVPVEKLAAEAEQRIGQQRKAAGKHDEAAGTEITSCLEAFKQLIPLRDRFFSAKKIKGLSLDKETELEEFMSKSGALSGRLSAWMQTYGNQYPALAQSVMDISAYLDRVCTEVRTRNKAPDAQQEKTQATNRAFSGLTAINGYVVKKYAESRAFGGGSEAQNKIGRLHQYANQERGMFKTGKEPVSKSDFARLKIQQENTPYYVTETLDRLDERMERFETEGVTENDLKESFIDAPEEENYNLKDISVQPMNVKPGGFDTFSQSLQSADLQMLFTEAPALDALQNDDKLKIWKQDDILPDEGPKRQQNIKDLADGADAVTKRVITGQPQNVKMLIRTLDKLGTGNENKPKLDDNELALKTYNTITQMYTVPLLNGLLSEFDTRHEKVRAASDQLLVQSSHYQRDLQVSKPSGSSLENGDTVNMDLLDELAQLVLAVRNEKQRV